MSRKSREDKSLWKLPTIYIFSGSYGPVRVKSYDPIDGATVFIYNSLHPSTSHQNGKEEEKKDDTDSSYYAHPMHTLAGHLQHLLLGEKTYNYDAAGKDSKTFIVIDLCEMFDNQDYYEDAIIKEDESLELTKQFGKSLLRSFRRMLLQNIKLVAHDNLCGIVLKLYRVIQSIDPDMVSALRLIHPRLSTKFINTNLVSSGNASNISSSIPVHLRIEKMNDPRMDAIRHFFPHGSTKETDPDQHWIASAFQDNNNTSTIGNFCYDPDYCDLMGKSLFVSQMTIEMNRH